MATIGIVGYYGWGNYGDELFAETFRQSLSPHKVLVLPQTTQHPYYIDPVRNLLKKVDVVVVGGGDLVIPWHYSDLYWHPAYLEKPVFVFGVGVPQWGGYDPGVVGRLRTFFKHPNIKSVVARDPRSKQWIVDNLGFDRNLSWCPDVVCSLDFQAKPALSLGRIFTLVTRAQGENWAGHEADVCRWAAKNGYHVRQLILAAGRTAADDLAEAAGLLYAPREIVVRGTTQELTDELLRSSLVASMKFHGCVVAMMAGIPAVSLSTADKFSTFYSMLGREDLVTTVVDPRKFKALDRAHEMAPPTEIAALRKKAREGLLGLAREINDFV